MNSIFENIFIKCRVISFMEFFYVVFIICIYIGILLDLFELVVIWDFISKVI